MPTGGVMTVANLRDYYRRNFLYSSHRLYLPQGKDRAMQTCRDCVFFICIVGRTEKKKGCGALLPKFAGAVKRIPEEINVVEVLQEIGKAGLQECLSCCGENLTACGFFHPRRR